MVRHPHNEEDDIPPTNELSRDARHCPTCGAPGIVPLDQQREANSANQDPVMLCPVCCVEFRTSGMCCFAALPPSDDDEINAWAQDTVEAAAGS